MVPCQLELIDNVRAICPPSTAAAAGFSPDHSGHSITTILSHLSSLSALVCFLWVRIQEGFAYEIVPLLGGESHESACARVTHQPLSWMSLQITRPPMTWSA